MAWSDSFKQQIASNIRAERSRRRMRQDELAERVNAYGFCWVHQTVGKVESGQRNVLAAEALALAEVFELRTVADLLDMTWAAKPLRLLP